MLTEFNKEQETKDISSIISTASCSSDGRVFFELFDAVGLSNMETPEKLCNVVPLIPSAADPVGAVTAKRLLIPQDWAKWDIAWMVTDFPVPAQPDWNKRVCFFESRMLFSRSMRFSSHGKVTPTLEIFPMSIPQMCARNSVAAPTSNTIFWRSFKLCTLAIVSIGRHANGTDFVL